MGNARSTMAGLTRREYETQLTEAHETMVRAGMEPMSNADCSICTSLDHATYRRVLGLFSAEEPSDG